MCPCDWRGLPHQPSVVAGVSTSYCLAVLCLPNCCRCCCDIKSPTTQLTLLCSVLLLQPMPLHQLWAGATLDTVVQPVGRLPLLLLIVAPPLLAENIGPSSSVLSSMAAMPLLLATSWCASRVVAALPPDDHGSYGCTAMCVCSLKFLQPPTLCTVSRLWLRNCHRMQACCSCVQTVL